MNRRAQRTLLTMLRTKLGMWPEKVEEETWIDYDVLRRVANVERKVDYTLDRVRALGELFVGMANGPFLLILKASAPGAFIGFADAHPTHNIRISFDYVQDRAPRRRRIRPNASVQGRITPVEDPGAYSLFFGLPRVLEEHVLLDENRGVRLARDIKRKFFSDITVYRRDRQNRDVLYRLTYDPQATRRLRLTAAD